MALFTISSICFTAISDSRTTSAHGRARLTLGRALFGSGDLAGAEAHGEEAVRLLASDAGSYITGALIPVDGGVLTG